MKAHTYILLTIDTIVAIKPVHINSIILTPDNTSTADITLYDGDSASSPKICVLRTTNNSRAYVFGEDGLHTQRGLYVDVGSNVDTVTISYDTE